MLALSPSLVYVHEPFNVNTPHELCPLSFNRWFRHIRPEEKNLYSEALRHVVELKYPLFHHLQDVESLKDVYRECRSAARYAWERWRGRSVLLKDPIALLSAEWLAEQFNLSVLVMIRHPAAFAGSLKVKGWSHPFEDFLAQPALMEEYFATYAEDIELFAAEEQDVVGQAALLWTLLYAVVLKYQERHPEWTFLRHEDVAREPIQTFRELYGHYNLTFTEDIQRQIEEYSNPSGSVSSDEPIRRDSQSVVRNWTERLTPGEVERIRDRTEPIASKFYEDSEW